VPDVKFTFVIKKWIFNIFLKNERTQFAISITLSSLQSEFDIINAVAHSDAITSIGIFSRFDYPNISNIFFNFAFFLYLLIAFDELGILWIVYSFGNVES